MAKDIKDLCQKIVDCAASSNANTYIERKATASKVMNNVREWMADFLQDSIRDHIKSMPQNTIEEKKQLAHWINGELRKFGLALRCPKTGKPPILVVDAGTGGPNGAFRFEGINEAGIKTRLSSRNQLSEINIITDSEQRANWTKFARSSKSNFEIGD